MISNTLQTLIKHYYYLELKKLFWQKFVKNVSFVETSKRVCRHVWLWRLQKWRKKIIIHFSFFSFLSFHFSFFSCLTAEKSKEKVALPVLWLITELLKFHFHSFYSFWWKRFKINELLSFTFIHSDKKDSRNVEKEIYNKSKSKVQCDE